MLASGLTSGTDMQAVAHVISKLDVQSARLSSGLIIYAVNIISLSCADGRTAGLTSGIDILACNVISLSCADGAGRGLHGRPLPEVPPPKEKERTGPFLLLWTPSSFP